MLSILGCSDITCAAGFGHGESLECSLLGKNLWISINTEQNASLHIWQLIQENGSLAKKGRYDYNASIRINENHKYFQTGIRENRDRLKIFLK